MEAGGGGREERKIKADVEVDSSSPVRWCLLPQTFLKGNCRETEPWGGESLRGESDANMTGLVSMADVGGFFHLSAEYKMGPCEPSRYRDLR